MWRGSGSKSLPQFEVCEAYSLPLDAGKMFLVKLEVHATNAKARKNINYCIQELNARKKIEKVSIERGFFAQKPSVAKKLDLMGCLGALASLSKAFPLLLSSSKSIAG